MQIGWGKGAFGFIGKMADIREDVSEYMDFPPPLPEMPEEDERAKEDCLLLDVYVPQDVFNQKGSKLGGMQSPSSPRVAPFNTFQRMLWCGFMVEDTYLVIRRKPSDP